MENFEGWKCFTQHIFAQDNLPVEILLTKAGVEKFVESFGFQQHNEFIDELDKSRAYHFQNGVCVLGETPVPIENLVIASRRIGVLVGGESSVSKKVFEAVIKCIQTLKKDYVSKIEVIQEQSSCSVTLDIDFSTLIDQRYVDFIKGPVKAATTLAGFDSSLEIRTLRSSVNYFEPGPPKHGFGLLQRAFIIEPRDGTALSERRYFALAPVNSESLKKLLTDFEAVFRKT